MRRTRGAVPPGMRLCLIASHSRFTVPRAVSAMRAGVLGLANAGPFLPIMGTDFGLTAFWRVRGWLTKALLQLSSLLSFPVVKLATHTVTDLVPNLAP